MRRHTRAFLSLALAGWLLASCASDKAPAEAALKAAEEAVNAVKADATRFVPDQARTLEAALTSAKEKASKGDYKGALADAQALAPKARELATAAAAKKTELTTAWQGMSDGLPKVVEAIKGRVDVLSQAKKLPAGMTAVTLAAAKQGLADITQQWTAATDAFKTGNVADAIAKGTAVKTKAAEVLTALGMPVPAALKS